MGLREEIDTSGIHTTHKELPITPRKRGRNLPENMGVDINEKPNNGYDFESLDFWLARAEKVLTIKIARRDNA